MGSLKAANTYFHTNCSMSQPKKAESKFSKSADLCGNKCGLLSKVSLLQLMRQVSRRWLHYHQTSFTAAVYCSCERKRSFDGHWVVRCPQRTSTCNLSFSSVLSMIDLPSIVQTPEWLPKKTISFLKKVSRQAGCELGKVATHPITSGTINIRFSHCSSTFTKIRKLHISNIPLASFRCIIISSTYPCHCG